MEGEIYSAIRYHEKVMVVCSRESLASEAVRDEIDQAVQKQKESPDRWVLLPIAIDDTAYQEDSEFASRLRRHVIEDYDEAIRLRPEYAEAYNNRGNAYSKKGDQDRAIADYNEAIRLRPEYAEAYNNRGNAYAGKGDQDRAIADYDEAIRLRPEYAEAYYNRGVASSRKGDQVRAIADYDEAIRLRPEDAEAYYNLACAYSLREEIDVCVANLERAVAQDQKFREMGRGDEDLAWARGDARVRKLLDMT